MPPKTRSLPLLHVAPGLQKRGLKLKTSLVESSQQPNRHAQVVAKHFYAHTGTPAHYTNVVIGWVVEARAGVPDRLEVSLRLVQRAAEYCLPLRQEVQVAEKAEHLSCARFLCVVCVRFAGCRREARVGSAFVSRR